MARVTWKIRDLPLCGVSMENGVLMVHLRLPATVTLPEGAKLWDPRPTLSYPCPLQPRSNVSLTPDELRFIAAPPGFVRRRIATSVPTSRRTHQSWVWTGVIDERGSEKLRAFEPPKDLQVFERLVELIKHDEHEEAKSLFLSQISARSQYAVAQDRFANRETRRRDAASSGRQRDVQYRTPSGQTHEQRLAIEHFERARQAGRSSSEAMARAADALKCSIGAIRKRLSRAGLRISTKGQQGRPRKK